MINTFRQEFENQLTKQIEAYVRQYGGDSPQAKSATEYTKGVHDGFDTTFDKAVN